MFQQIYRHLPVSNVASEFDETVSRRDLEHAVINLIDSEVCVKGTENRKCEDATKISRDFYKTIQIKNVLIKFSYFIHTYNTEVCPLQL